MHFLLFHTPTKEGIIATTKDPPEKKKTAKKTEKEKMVKIKMPLTRNEKDDVFVSVNMRTWLIKRGVEVEVPECVAEVLRHQEQSLEEAYEYTEKMQNVVVGQ